MPKCYCVDYGTEASPDKWDPFRKGDPRVGHVLLVNASDELVFYGLNSCLGILLLLSDGRRLAGHVVEFNDQHPMASAAENAHRVLGEMLQLKPANLTVTKAIFIFNSGSWNLHGLLGDLGMPKYLGINYRPADKKIDAEVLPEAITIKEREGGKNWSVTKWFSQSGDIDFK